MKTILLTLAIAMVSLGNAQSLLDTKLADRIGVLRLYYTFNATSNPNHAYAPFRKVPFRTFGFDGEIYDFEQGGERWHFSSKVSDDLIWLIGSMIKGTEDEEYCNVTGLLGLKFGHNLFSSDKINISAGFSLTDYMVILPEVDANGFYQGNDMEPHGWYWAAGPNLFIDYHIFDSFTLHANVNYDFGFLTINKGSDVAVIDGYEKPFFLGTRFTLNHDLGMFLQFQTTTAFDRGVHNQNITRREFQVGYRFFLTSK